MLKQEGVPDVGKRVQVAEEHRDVETYGEWRTVPGFDPQKILVSSMGWIKVRQIKDASAKEATPTKGSFNAKEKRHRIGYEKAMYFVYHLICRAFAGPQPAPQHTVDHKDQDTTNNGAKNLRWATKAEQNKNRGIMKQHRNSVPLLGRKVGAGDDAWERYDSSCDAAAKLNLHHGNVSKVVRGVFTQTGGYEFKIDGGRIEPQEVEGEVWYKSFDDPDTWRFSILGRAQYRHHGRWQPKFTPVAVSGQVYPVVTVNGKVRLFHVCLWEAKHRRRVMDGYIVDHILPVLQGGGNELTNLQEISTRENTKKAVKKPVGKRELTKGCAVLCWDVGSRESEARPYASLSEAGRKEGVNYQTIGMAFSNNPGEECVQSKGRMWKKA